MLENIRLSLQGIWSHKMRSFLTMLGIIIGIASIIAIVSTIQGSNEKIKQDLIGAGNNTVPVSLYQGDGEYDMNDYQSLPEGVPVITEEVRQEIEAIDEVESAALYRRREYATNVFNGDASFMGNTYGITNHYLDTYGYVVSSGRRFVEEDFTKYRKVVLMDKTAASTLFYDQDPLGKTIEIGGHPFTVIGIVQEREEYTPDIEDIEGYYEYMLERSNGGIYIPIDTWPVVYRYDEPQNLLIKAKTTDDMSAAGRKAAEILNKSLTVKDSNVKYKSGNALDSDEAKKKLSQSTNIQLIWIASISLLVGGIGVMNIMLVTVTERTSEIGLKKAIGAKKKSILGQFLVESAVLTSLGGIIGVVAGIIMAEVISRVAEIPVAVSVPAIIIAVVFSMLIGIIFGLLPSIQASNLNPIDALRHE